MLQAGLLSAAKQGGPHAVIRAVSQHSPNSMTRGVLQPLVPQASPLADCLKFIEGHCPQHGYTA